MYNRTGLVEEKCQSFSCICYVYKSAMRIAQSGMRLPPAKAIAIESSLQPLQK